MSDAAVWAPETAEYDAFFSAVSHGSLEDVKTALISAVHIDALRAEAYGEGKSALHMASAAGRTDVVEFLLTRGASVDI